MAQPGSPSNDATVPASSSSAAALPDWEMLSMSMSGSALGKPAAGSRDSVKPHPENPNPQIESSFSEVDQETPNPDADAWGGSLHTSVNRDGSADVVAEPFTEGWKPHSSTPSGLYGYDAERGYGGQKREEEEARLPSQGAETYYESNVSMVVAEGSFVSATGDASIMSYAQSDDVEFELVSPKTRNKGGKRSKKSSRVLWSIGVAAAMVGISILGHRWQLACHDNQQLRIELAEKDEKLTDLEYQVNRLKDLVGGYRVPNARGSSV